MNQAALKELVEKKLITDEQYEHLEPIYSKKILSVFYELRTLLYLGVMLFTTGTGWLIYQNIDSIGHGVVLASLTALTIACFAYVVKHEVGYSNERVESPIPYYDYVLLLGCLLFVSIQGYVHVQYETFTDYLSWNTLLTAAVFFYAAYRFDHLGVLSLAITTLASFFGISVSAQRWYGGEFFSEGQLQIIAIVFSAGLMATALWLDKRLIKRHFTFTYLNFSLLIYFSGCVAGLFIDEYVYFIYILLIIGGCYVTWLQARYRKSFLFLTYAFIAGYIAITYFLADTIFQAEPTLWFLYSLLSCGGFIYFIIKYRTIFKR